MDNILVGIDPGTTTGFAIMNLRTKEVTFGSERNMGMNSLIKKVLSYGFVVAVGSDKKPCPLFVERFSSKTGANLIVPSINLSDEKKRALTTDFNYKNEHERDALSALMNTYKRLKHLLTNIKNFFEKEELSEKEKKSIERLVFQAHSIKESVRIVRNEEFNKENIPKMKNNKEKKEKEEKVKNMEKTKKIRKEKELLIIRKLTRELEIIRDNNDRLKHKINDSKKLIDELMLSVNRSKKYADKRLYDEVLAENKSLKEDIIKKEGMINKMNERMNYILSNINEKIVIPKFQNLILKDVTKRIKELRDNVIILVENPNEYSTTAIKRLKKKITTIIFVKEPNRRTRGELNFNFINMKKLKVFFKSDGFVLIQKKELNKMVNTKDAFEKLIYKYKKKRTEKDNEM